MISKGLIPGLMSEGGLDFILGSVGRKQGIAVSDCCGPVGIFSVLLSCN